MTKFPFISTDTRDIWYVKIVKFLLQHGYSATPVDSSLFIKTRNGQLSIILIYIDDLIVIGDDLEELTRMR